MARKKTWTEKLDNDRPHKVKPVPKDMAGMKAGEIMLVPSARIVDDFIRSIPRTHRYGCEDVAQEAGRTVQGRGDLPDHGRHSRTDRGRGGM